MIDGISQATDKERLLEAFCKWIDKDFELHQFTIHYWMNLDAHNFENCKYLSPLLIELFNKNEERITTDNKW